MFAIFTEYVNIGQHKKFFENLAKKEILDVKILQKSINEKNFL
jgi:hypothetical protein